MRRPPQPATLLRQLLFALCLLPGSSWAGLMPQVFGGAPEPDLPRATLHDFDAVLLRIWQRDLRLSALDLLDGARVYSQTIRVRPQGPLLFELSGKASFFQ